MAQFVKFLAKYLVRRLGLIGGFVAAGLVRISAETEISDIDAPPHSYRQRPPKDAFTRIQDDVVSGKILLDRSSELQFVASLLRALGIPASSQMLVFSTTSLQLSLISPQNPRAVYFNEDTYLGYIPGGRIEIVSMDPDLGGIFYIFDIPKGDRPLSFERSGRCMNCHAREDTSQVPGLVVKSVIPGPGGGSLIAYRLGESGHGIPLDQRFGGWHVTGAEDFTNHFGNLTGRLADGNLTRIPNPPGVRFSYARYPAATSDLLPQLLLEHQSGFVNRVLVATYLARQFLQGNSGQLTSVQHAELDSQARGIVKYLLFADEAALPAGGVRGDPTFKKDFMSSSLSDEKGQSLKDFELQTRLFRHRCSYMIYSTVFKGLPGVMKERVYRLMKEALKPVSTTTEFAYLPVSERLAIRSILKATLSDLPPDW